MLVTLSALLVFAADVDPEPPLAPPVIKFQSATANEGSVTLTFEVSNRNGVRVPYLGYQVDDDSKLIAPTYRMQELKGNAWKVSGLGWCGTGRGPVTLPAKGKVMFRAHVHQKDWDAVKVGLVWFANAERKNPTVAWSDAVTKKSAGVK